MQIVSADDVLEPSARGAHVAIGNFDGLHLGHQRLFAVARARAGVAAGRSGVVTFEPHPTRVLSPALAPPRIYTVDEKRRGIAGFGIDQLVELRFDAALAALRPEAFVERLLVQRLGVSSVVVGEGFRFGYRAAGTIDDLRRCLAGVPVEVVAPVRTESGLVCSSTKVRELVLEGRVEQAALLLGRPYDLQGQVVAGDRRGRTIGVPTANVAVTRELLPKVGVYASIAQMADGSRWLSVTNIGLRPTFDGQGVRIETHLLDFPSAANVDAAHPPRSAQPGDLYGQELKVELIARIRDEQRFASIDELRSQIDVDKATARALLAARGARAGAGVTGPVP